MARKVDVEQLVTAADIADRLGVTHPQLVHKWRERHADFPEPIMERGRCLVWVWPDVERWAKRTGRL